uniref:Family with sequence similarity 71 member E2 n=1 Tax=Molossus molossus TaxID=27622 RepID=A0A7J8C764_MOLMO|nr:family with sequence similarity 71 member E2 [Molossus molossus]
MNRLWNTRRPDPLPAPPQWVPILGQLQKTLQKREYLPLRSLPMFESNFVQVTSQGAPVYVHHKPNYLTLGVAATLPDPGLPDLLLIAKPSENKDCSNLILTRMLPLDLVHLYVHNLSAWRLKLHLITGRYYYLELDAPAREIAFLFDRWIRLISLLREPAAFWAPRTLHTPLSDLAPPASTWRLQDKPHTRCSGPVMRVDPTISRKVPTSQKQRKAKPLKRRFKSQAVGDSVPLICSQLEHTDSRKKGTGNASHPEHALPSSVAKSPVSEKSSFSIWTIFSNFPNSIDQKLSSSKGRSPVYDRAVVLGGLVETPSPSISENSPDIAFLVSCEQLDMQQGFKDPTDHESSTLSSNSFSQDTYSPNFYLPSPHSSVPRHHKKARPLGSAQKWWLPLSQNTSSIPATSRKAPFILDQSQKVSARPAAPQKTSILASVPQRAPAVPAPSWKTPHVLAIPQKPMPRPVPNQKSLFLPTPSQMALDPADVGMLPVGSHAGDVLKKSQPEGRTEPLVLVGTQEMQVTEMRAQKVSLEPPFNTTKKKMKKVVISTAREVTLDGLKGKDTLEDKVCSMKEEKSMVVPGFKSKMTGQQKKWVKTQELVMEGAPKEHRRPLPAEELTPSKRMIMANSKESPMRPKLFGLPSWRSTPRVRMSPKSLYSRQVTVLEDTSVVLGEQPQLGSWAKGSKGLRLKETSSPRAAVEAKKLPSDPIRASKVHARSKRAPSSLKMNRHSQVPIPLPATRWEDVQSPIVPTSISKTEVRMSQKPNRESQEMPGMPDQLPLAKTEFSLGILMPKLLEIDNMRGVAKNVKKKKKISVFTPWPSIHGSQRLQ